LSISNSAGILNLNGKDLSLSTSSTFSNEGTLKLIGSEVLTNFINDTDSGTVEYTGTGSYSSLVCGNSYYNLVFSGGGTYSLDNALTVNRNLSISNSAGILNLNGKDLSLSTSSTFSNEGTLKLIGSEVLTNFTNDTDSGTVEYTGTNGPYTLKSFTGPDYYNLKINGEGATFNLPSDLDINGDLIITAGTLDVTSNNYNINIAGNFSNEGTFNPRQGTVTFDGTSASYITGNNTFYNLIIDTNTDGQKTVYFEANNTQTITGNLTLTGHQNKILTIRSTIDGTCAILDIPNSITTGVDYVDVKDNKIAGSNTITAGINSINSGNNINWIFTKEITLSKKEITLFDYLNSPLRIPIESMLYVTVKFVPRGYYIPSLNLIGYVYVPITFFEPDPILYILRKIKYLTTPHIIFLP
ncbi:MAG: hypothetical protein NC925_01315, partial [Candidatus Omnitrophica bacterium]|nr:hypothetical protein [Candidatus Omnitrophota bacterium]